MAAAPAGRMLLRAAAVCCALGCVQARGAPQKTAPPENNLDGFAGLTNTQIQLDVYARTYEACKALAQAAFDAMEACAMQQVCTETGRDLYESDTKLHRQLLEFSIWHGVEASVDTIIGEESATDEVLMESGEEMELEVQP